MNNSTESAPPLNLEQLKKRAKDLKKTHAKDGLINAKRIQRALPGAELLSRAEIAAQPLRLAQAQLVIARELGFASWPRLKRSVEQSASNATTPEMKLVQAAMAGNQKQVATLLSTNPELASASLHTAAALADESAMELAKAGTQAINMAAGPFSCTPLAYVCSARLGVDVPDMRKQRAAIAAALIDQGRRP